MRICKDLYVFFAFQLLITFVVSAQSLDKKVTIYFENKIGIDPLILGNPVKNINGEEMRIERYKYYISHLTVTDIKGNTQMVSSQYYLIDESDSSSKKIKLDLPAGNIKSIHFLLGVDSIRNVSGVQTGVLDPLQGMFWTWNSGYIMAKLEGVSASANTPGNRFTYHIGGFKTGMNTVKEIDLALPNTSGPLQEIHISADINHWFRGNTIVKIAETPICHTPGALAVKIADNYMTMFSINRVN